MNLPNHELTMTVLMTPDMANFSGNVHGGTILKLLDQVAYACASRYAGRYVVTLSVDQVMFREPIHVGELVSFLASVNYTGRTSMEVGIKVVDRGHPAADRAPRQQLLLHDGGPGRRAPARAGATAGAGHARPAAPLRGGQGAAATARGVRRANARDAPASLNGALHPFPRGLRKAAGHRFRSRRGVAKNGPASMGRCPDHRRKRP